MKTKRVIEKAQDHVAAWLGLDAAQRVPLVRAMLQPRTGDAAGYWLQLVIATALATLGLALDSTAVVIGAMLIAPLMRPIIELAMGLATGAAPLVFRAAGRSAVSVVVAVGVSAAIAWALPFHEETGELLARTAPSLLDLFVAAACALAGAYATLIARSDMASTAAGTSIGISLVPPLCTAGYGLAAGDLRMARGAALLFTANITGILTIASVVFVLVGFGQVDVAEEERSLDAAVRVGVAERMGRGWSRHARKRLGPVWRLVLPLLLLAAILVPLRRAVGEMTRRSEIQRKLGEILSDGKRRVVQHSIDLTASGAVVEAVVVGDASGARALDHDLRASLTALGEPDARVSVWAVPDASELTALAARVDEIPPPVAPEPPEVAARRSAADLGEAVRAAWPTSGTGTLIATWVEFGEVVQVRVVHLGPALGDAGRQLLARALPAEEAPPVVIEDVLEPVDAAPADGVSWLGPALALAERARATPQVNLCVLVPAPAAPVTDPRHPPSAAETSDEAARAVVREALRDALAGRAGVEISEGDAWRVVPVVGPCPPQSPAANPAASAPP